MDQAFVSVVYLGISYAIVKKCIISLCCQLQVDYKINGSHYL